MKVRWIALLLVLLAGCSLGNDSDGADPTPPSAQVLIEFDPYSFVAANETTAENLREYIEGATPEGTELLDVTVRSVEVEGEPVPAEIVSAAYDRGELSAEDFYLKVLKEVAPGKAREILGGKGVLVESEGTAVVATFPTENVLLYLVGPDPQDLEEIAAGLLRENGS